MKKKVIAFDVSKQEYTSWAKKYKKIQQILRIDHNVVIHSDEIDIDNIQSYDVLIITNPRFDYTSQEIGSMKKFLHLQEEGTEIGKSIAIFGSGYGNDTNNNSATSNPLLSLPNLSNFLLDYGIKYENDTVVRTSFFKYLHPKHVFIDDGIIHPTFQSFKNTQLDRNGSRDGKDSSSSKTSYFQYDMDDSLDIDVNADNVEDILTIVYPNGSTLETSPPSLPILSSGAVSFPANRPIGAVWDASTMKTISGQRQYGKVLVIGSSDMFADEWLGKEGNTYILNSLIHFLAQNDSAVVFDRSQSTKDTRIDESKTVPDIEALSERLRSCLQRNEPLPQDLNSILYTDMLAFDTSLIPDVMYLYNSLDVKKESLTLIPPEFELPVPPLKPAVFHPKMKELPPPALDKFDLDEEFAENSIRLAHLTNTCENEDCDYFIQEAGSIIGLLGGTETEVDAKDILHTLFNTVCFGICFIPQQSY